MGTVMKERVRQVHVGCEGCDWHFPHKSYQFAVMLAARHFNSTGHTVKAVITFKGEDNGHV